MVLRVTIFQCFAMTAHLRFATSPVKSTKPQRQNICFVIGRSEVQLSGRRTAVLSEGSRGFPQSLQVSSGLMLHIKPLPLVFLGAGIAQSV